MNLNILYKRYKNKTDKQIRKYLKNIKIVDKSNDKYLSYIK